MNNLDLLDILCKNSEELSEAKKTYLKYFSSNVSALTVFKSIFYPIKTLFKKLPDIEKKDLVLDCASFEKYKRMLNIVDSRAYVVHCADLSTLRGRVFFEKLDSPKIFYRSRYKGYWILLLPLIVVILKKKKLGESISLNFVFYCKALQDLIHYHQFLSLMNAKVFVTANEDSWNASLLAELCRKMGIMNVNVMHGRVYKAKQFYECSVVFGKQSWEETRKVASSRTRVEMVNLNELSGASKPLRSEPKRVMFFEQPFFWSYSVDMREKIFLLLNRLAEDGFDVYIKSHPTQTHSWNDTFKKLKLLPEMTPKMAAEQCDIAISYCSTVGLEIISLGIPVVYLNLNSILDEYVQIRFLKETSVPNYEDAYRLILSLRDPEKYWKYTQKQIDLLGQEYSSSNKFQIGRE